MFKHFPKFIASNKAKVEKLENFDVGIEPTIQEGMEKLVNETQKSLGEDSKCKCFIDDGKQIRSVVFWGNFKDKYYNICNK